MRGHAPRRHPLRLSEETVARLLPYVDERSLRAMRPRTTAPWSWLPRLLRAGAVTLGNDVCFRPGRFREADASGLALIAHECVHVRQYREMGAIPFLFRYLVGAVRVRFNHDAHPLEREPQELQARARGDLGVLFT